MEADDERKKALGTPVGQGDGMRAERYWDASREWASRWGACIRSIIRIRDGFGGIGHDSCAPVGIACNGQRRHLHGRSGISRRRTRQRVR